jgi:hypothetical protein
MLVLHAFLALLAGFVSMAILIAAATAALAKFVPEWTGTPGQPRAGFLFVNLGYSLAAAMAGGYITAWVSMENPLILVLALALTVLLLTALSALQQRGQHPIWFQLLMSAITPAGVVLGGLARLRVMGF